MVDPSLNPEGAEPSDLLKKRHLEEFQSELDAKQRRAALRERQPHLFARMAILERLVDLQAARGGTFPPKVIFIHMPDYVMNIRRVGKVDAETLTVALEVYEHNDIVPGILWVPLDHIWWAGTTDLPISEKQMSLRARPNPKSPHPTEYQDLRLRLSGLPPLKED